ncbi:MAG: HAMP domain-containing sensor histidine kinase [Parasphingorhabdus sp.]|nr:HAMP domain-containing sensor histidine kinase [Parasphingorhabdus sp.]
MRFDDRLSTVLKGALPEGLAAAMQWRQVVDLLAQKPGALANEDVQSGLIRLRDLHDRVPAEARLDGVRTLQGRLRSSPLLVYLCADEDQICDAAVAAADLPDDVWHDIANALPPRVARKTPRQTADKAETERFAGSISSAKTGQDRSQIGELVARIADFQRTREVEAPVEQTAPAAIAETPFTVIQFETDDSGTISWVSGPPRGALAGVSIAYPAFDDGPGPDAYGAAAFRQRMPLENARMRLCGAPMVEGDWRITAIPFFGEKTGRFRGYRGLMRRPNIAEDVANHDVDVAQGEQLQQLVHELRTPLNAIIGFSEIIEQQLFGPVSREYRGLARNIMDEAQRLLAGFEDLDIAAQLDANRIGSGQGLTEADWLFGKLTARLQGLTDSRQVELNIKKIEPVRAFALDGGALERVFSRLLSAVIIACENGEVLTAELRTYVGLNPVNQFRISRPVQLSGLGEDQLLDPSRPVEGEADDAPLLGLGFSLRLVRNLARAAGGNMAVDDETISLTLPAARTSKIDLRGREHE